MPTSKKERKAQNLLFIFPFFISKKKLFLYSFTALEKQTNKNPKAQFASTIYFLALQLSI